MRRFILLFALVAMVFVGCANPTSGSTEDTPVENKPTSTTPQGTPTPVVDKSPFEYVKPACVNLADYTYVGDYIFADSMNFAEWKYSNATTNYWLAFEKISRVKNENEATQIWRTNHNTLTDFPVVKATKYKVYVNNERLNNTLVFNNLFDAIDGNYDNTRFKVKKNDDGTFLIICDNADNFSDYIAY